MTGEVGQFFKAAEGYELNECQAFIIRYASQFEIQDIEHAREIHAEAECEY
ncbi:MAG: hypothetical protein ACRCWB_11660 [Enterovibrio sp.]